MPDKIIEKSPAKINLFLKIINKRDDGYHNIRTGITFIDLYDEISVQPHNKFEVIYTGKFAPKNNLFEDCIIDKLFAYIQEDKPKLLFTISKNFPYEAGLGSASSNVASVIKILENLIFKIRKKTFCDLAICPFLVYFTPDLTNNFIFFEKMFDLNYSIFVTV